MVWRRRASIGMASSRTPPRVRDVTRFGGTNRLRSRTSYTFAPERLTAFPLRSRRVVGRLGLSDDMIVFLPEVAECSVCMSFPHDRISCGLPGGSRCARAKDRPVLLSIFVRLRVWPERHRAQSCAIALRSPAPERPSNLTVKGYSPWIYSTPRRGHPHLARLARLSRSASTRRRCHRRHRPLCRHRHRHPVARLEAQGASKAP